MTGLDRFIQSWRIRKARPFVRAGARVLDIGASDGGPLYRQVPGIAAYVGVDPDIPGDRELAANARLVKGLFPESVAGEEPFDCITMLAVLEHIPEDVQKKLAADCAAYLKPSGRLVITVPSPFVDHILAVLRAMKLIHGMSLEQHHGYDVRQTPVRFGAAGFRLVKCGRFQMGLNNLFVFDKEGDR